MRKKGYYLKYVIGINTVKFKAIINLDHPILEK
jgi:hypothetical protein